MELSSEGELMLAHARAVLRAASNAEEAMRLLQKHPRREVLAIGYVAGEMENMLASALRSFERLFPAAEISLTAMSPQAQERALISRELDIAFVGNPWRNLEERLSVQVLQKQRVHAVVSDQHRLAFRKQVPLKEFSAEEFVGFRDESFPGRNETIITACQTAGFTPKFRRFATELSAVFALVAAGKGVTLSAGPSHFPQLGTVFVKLKETIPPLVSAVAIRKEEARPSTKKLIELCKGQSDLPNVVEDFRSPEVRRAGNGGAPVAMRQFPALNVAESNECCCSVR
jgi:DNA-binding transcriptional LysR family regulator